ncbi:MAG TPA: M48 family metalloprotease, partial [Actinomycetota bacterium]|nr:M48 family metalloprotease [Actinomycetota bacterium]
ARLTRYPPGLAGALRKIAAVPNQMRVANNATAHLWISQPSRLPGFSYSFAERLFSTHPPLEERIKALEEM